MKLSSFVFILFVFMLNIFSVPQEKKPAIHFKKYNRSLFLEYYKSQ